MYVRNVIRKEMVCMMDYNKLEELNKKFAQESKEMQSEFCELFRKLYESQFNDGFYSEEEKENFKKWFEGKT
jgi:hypothetical protein